MKPVRHILLLGVALSSFWLLAGCQSDVPLQTTTGEPAFMLNVEILGRTLEASLDADGRLIANVSLASTDGTAILTIDKGTQLLDGDGKPLSSLWLKTDPEPLSPPDDAHIIGEVYSLGPQDAAFDRPLKLTLSYDPQEIPEGVREDNVYIVPYDASTGWGSYSYKRVETDKHRVTTQIERFTQYAVMAPAKASSPQHTKQPATSTDLASIPLRQALASGLPTLAEFGSSTCVPCKQMKSILGELAIEYDGRLNVVIIEVYDQMELTKQYEIMAIPTQIIFSSNGEEIGRHTGVWPKEDIIAQLKEVGIE